MRGAGEPRPVEMDIDSVGPSAGGASGVGGNPSSAQTGTPAVVMTPLQLEIPGQDMMDVEPGFSGGQFLASGGAAHVAPLASSSPISSVPGGVASPSQGTRAIPPTTGTHPGCTSPSVPNPINHSAHVASPSFSAPALDAAGVVGLRPVPAPPVVVLTKSDVHAMPYVFFEFVKRDVFIKCPLCLCSLVVEGPAMALQCQVLCDLAVADGFMTSIILVYLFLVSYVLNTQEAQAT